MAKCLEIGSVLNDAKIVLRKAGIASPDVDAEILVSTCLGLRRSDLYIDLRRTITEELAEKVRGMVMMRASRVPLQRIIGKCEFMSLEFRMAEGVFIPRPETEILIETVISEAKKMAPPLLALEIGTGCGVIAVSLCHYLNGLKVVATDISTQAVLVARENARLNGVSERIDFVVGDGADFIKDLGDRRGFDIIVSNPPYIRSDEIDGLEPEVRLYDPRIAIDGGDDGLAFYKRIVGRIGDLLRVGGLVAFEIGAYQADDLRDLLEGCGIADIRVEKDLSGLDRVIKGRKKNGQDSGQRRKEASRNSDHRRS